MSEEVKEELKASEENLEILRDRSRTLDTIYNTIGAMTVEKQQLVGHAMATRNQVEEKAKEILRNAGVEEDKLKDYRINLENGIITEAPAQQQS